MTTEEAYAMIAVKTALDQPAVKAMYSDGARLMHEISESDYYPLDLVAYAISKTFDRNRLYPNPLGNAAAYTVKLLDDWKKQGFQTRQDVQEAKDDYYHYG